MKTPVDGPGSFEAAGAFHCQEIAKKMSQDVDAVPRSAQFSAGTFIVLEASGMPTEL